MALSLTITTKDQSFDFTEGEDGIESIGLEMYRDPQFIIIGLKYEDDVKTNMYLNREGIEAIVLHDNDPTPDNEWVEDEESNVTKLH